MSDMDDGGVCPECQQRKRSLPCYIEASTTERCWDRGGRDAHKVENSAESSARGCIEVQSLDKECTTRERRGIQGLDKYVNLELSVPRSQS
jgi:hypothetical protein